MTGSGVDISKLPTRTLRAGTLLYRIHRAEHGPWYFADSDKGRFNPCGSGSRGTCYWAEKPLGAWIESFRTVMTLAADDVDDRALSVITLGQDLRLCDLTVKRALAAGATVRITGGASYGASQALADELQSVADGIRYRVSHDLSAKMVGIAWFGESGAADAARLKRLPTATTISIPEDLIEAASKQFRYSVLPRPV